MVTAIVTTYKREPAVVVRAVKSILNQTYKDLEIIVVDDSPEDYTLRNAVKEQIKLLDDRIQYIRHEKNSGACQARNTGLAMAKGEYVAYLDDDDEWVPDKIEKQLSVFETGSEELGLVYCGGLWINEETKKTKVNIPEKHCGTIFDEVIKKNFIGGTSGPMMRTSYLQAIGGFDPLMQASQDADVWLRMAEKYTIDFVAEPLYVYYDIHAGEQISTNPNKKLAGIQRLYQKFNGYLAMHPEAHSILLGKMAYFYSWTGDLKMGLKTWKDSCYLQPKCVRENVANLLRVLQKYWFYVKKKSAEK